MSYTCTPALKSDRFAQLSAIVQKPSESDARDENNGKRLAGIFTDIGFAYFVGVLSFTISLIPAFTGLLADIGDTAGGIALKLFKLGLSNFSGMLKLIGGNFFGVSDFGSSGDAKVLYGLSNGRSFFVHNYSIEVINYKQPGIRGGVPLVPKPHYREF